MNKLLMDIAKRLVCKAIKVNTEEYKIQVSYKFISGVGTINVTIFKKDSTVSFYFYDDNPHNERHISKFRYILRIIRKGSKK